MLSNRFTLVCAVPAVVAVLAACGGVPPAAGGTAAGGKVDKTNAAACENGVPGVQDGNINIGVNVTATGKSALTGQYMKDSLDIALAELNDAGGVKGKKLKLIYQDNQSTNPGAVSALTKSLSQDNVFTVIGPITSTQIQAMLPVLKSAHVPMMVGGTNKDLTDQGGGLLFRFRPSDELAAKAMVQWAVKSRGAKSIGLLHDSDAAGSGAAKIIEAAAKEAGVSLKSEAYTTGDKDFTGQLVNLRNSKPDVLIVNSTAPADAAIISRQLKELGLGMPVIGSPSYSSQATLSLSGAFGNGLYVMVDFLPGANPKSKDFSKKFQAKTGSAPDLFSAWPYDALQVVAATIDKVGCDRQAFMDALRATKDYQGVQGTLTSNAKGDLNANLLVVQIRNGKPELIDTVKVSS